jgi:hypothetical protein
MEIETEDSKFGTLTEAYNVIVSARDSIAKLKDQIDHDFNKEEHPYYFSNPLDYRHNLNEQVESIRTGLTKFVIGQVGKKYHEMNTDLDDKAIHDFVDKQGYFNHIEVLQFIKEKYADVDAEALRQIKAIVKGSLLPVGNFGEGADRWATANKPEHIRMDGNSAGIELRVWGRDGSEQKSKLSALIKLIQITLNNVKPSLTKDITVERGATYRDSKIKSLRYFKNNSLKLIFYQKPDADKVIGAILS